MIQASKNRMLETWFVRYTRWYLRRNFHAVHLLGELPASADRNERRPTLVCVNHSSWWDVLLGLYVASDLLQQEFYGVMDEQQLNRYRFFAHLGMIGVDRSRLSGAREFLRYGIDLLRGQPRTLWLTPQGEFAANDIRPIHFQPGVGHLAAALGDFSLLTVAFHYEFWDERLPEAFVAIAPLQSFAREEACSGADGEMRPTFDRRGFVHTQERRLESLMDTLLANVRQRNRSAFRPLLRGKSGISSTYDATRSVAARLRGEALPQEHSEVATPTWKKRK